MSSSISEQRQDGWSVDRLAQLHLGFAPSRILMTALELDVFSQIAAGKTTAPEIAAAAHATQRGMRMLLDALVSLELLSKNGRGYELTAVAAQVLVRESPDYMGDLLALGKMWDAWGHLTDIVRTGKPYHTVDRQQEAEAFFPKLVRGLHVMNREPARRTAELLCNGGSRPNLRVVDVGCGSAVWSIPVAKADPAVRVTAQDFPGMLEETRGYLRLAGVENQYDYLPGDLKQVDFGVEQFDLALLGNIVHSEGEKASRDLFHRLFRALGRSGQIVVIDMIPNDERTGTPFALMFALNMLVNTDFGDTYTVAEYTEWLSEAGFARVSTADIGFHSPLILGHKS